MCALKSESESEMLVSQKEKQGRTVEVPLHLFSEVLTVDSHQWERGHFRFWTRSSTRSSILDTVLSL